MKSVLNQIKVKAIIAFTLLIIINLAAEKWHIRWDFTKDKRYTLSDITNHGRSFAGKRV